MTRSRWAASSLLSMAAGAALLGAAWACSSPDHPPVLPNLPPKEAGDKADVPTPSSCTVEDGGCNQLQNCGSKVYVVEYASTAPAPAGGAVVDGIYALSDYKIFTGAGGPAGNTGGWFRQTMSVTTGDAGVADAGAGDAGARQEMDWLGVLEISNAPATKNTSGRITFKLESPFTASIAFSCPSSGSPYAGPYTATPTELVLFGDAPSGRAVITYVKQ